MRTQETCEDKHDICASWAAGGHCTGAMMLSDCTKSCDACVGGEMHEPFLKNGTVALKSVHGTFLSAKADGSAEFDRDSAGGWEQFHLEILEGDTITLLGVHGMYVSAKSDGSVEADRSEARGWEAFTIEDHGNERFSLESVHGKYLSAQTDGSAQWDRDYAGGWEKFQLVYPADPKW